MSKDDARSPVMWGHIRNLISGADGLIDIQTDRVVKYIEVRDDDNRQPDTPAVDREALARELFLAEHPAASAAWDAPGNAGKSAWWIKADAIIESGILRDVREVRHEHGERIADAVMPKLVDVYGTNGFPVRLLRQALGYVLSPAPKAKP